MRIDIQLCGFKYCKYLLDCNCMATALQREGCEYSYYKQAEAEGRILPIKIGDTTYYVTDQTDDEPPHIGEFEVYAIKLDASGKISVAIDYNDFDEVGTQWALLTREEAEEVLKEKLAEQAKEGQNDR